MNSYTITISPNDDSGNTTTLLVDTSGDQAMITDVHLHAGRGLSAGRVPTVDFGLLLRAVNATSTTPSIAAAAAKPAAPEPVAVDEEPDPTATPRTGRAARTRRRATKAAPEPTPAPAARRGRGGRASAAKTAAAPKATARKAAKATKAAKAADASGERAYRRMPDDFATVQEQLGTARAIAEHYGVPRYTVHSWIRRIRSATPSTDE